MTSFSQMGTTQPTQHTKQCDCRSVAQRTSANIARCFHETRHLQHMYSCNITAPHTRDFPQHHYQTPYPTPSDRSPHPTILQARCDDQHHARSWQCTARTPTTQVRCQSNHFAPDDKLQHAAGITSHLHQKVKHQPQHAFPHRVPQHIRRPATAFTRPSRVPHELQSLLRHPKLPEGLKECLPKANWRDKPRGC